MSADSDNEKEEEDPGFDDEFSPDDCPTIDESN